MNKNNLIFFLIFLIFPKNLVAEEKPYSLFAKWESGINFSNQDKSFQFKINGRIHNDWAFFISHDDEIEDRFGELNDSTEFRRLRLDMSGKYYESLEFKFQVDFAGGENDLKDVYISLLDLPFGNLRVGHFREPFSFTELTSSKYVSFLERPFIFTPDRNSGIGLNDFNEDLRLSWALGVFKETDGFGSGESSGGEYSYTGRIARALIDNPEKQTLLHLGVSYSFRKPSLNNLSYSSRPESSLAPRFIEFADIQSEEVQLANIELAAVSNSLSFQAEYAAAFVDAAAEERSGKENFYSWYVESSYFLTGESKPYSADKAVFARVKPLGPFLGESRGKGAFELKARYSESKLNDDFILGGQMSIFSFGANWYLHSHARVLTDFLIVDLDGGGDTNILQTRLALDF